MKQVVFLVGMLLILLAICCKPKAQPKREELARTATAPSQQPAKFDVNDPATWPDALDATVAAPQNHKVVLENERARAGGDRPTRGARTRPRTQMTKRNVRYGGGSYEGQLSARPLTRWEQP